MKERSLSLSLCLSSSSYYGLTVWFPDMIKYLQKQEYSSRTKVFVKEKVEHVTFNFTLENQVHRQGEYFNDKWVSFLFDELGWLGWSRLQDGKKP